MTEFIISMAIAFLALVVSVISLREGIITRRTSFKPLLSPGRIKEIVNDDNLFACNFEYPASDDNLGEPKVVYFGIRNIGKGPANNVRVLNFQSEDKEPHIFRVGSNVIRIPENIAVPFTIRVARADESEYHFVTFITTICYDDLFGNTYYLSIRLWINGNDVSVIEYIDKKKPNWKEYNNVVWREVESNGFFETRRIE